MKRVNYQCVFRPAVVLLVLLEVACAAAGAPKVECDSHLRPINSAAPEVSTPSVKP